MVKETQAVEMMSSLARKHPLPRMATVRQKFAEDKIEDIAGELRRKCARTEIGVRLSRIRKGQSVAITAGSRGVANTAEVIREIAALVKERGGVPFVFPAMGSHGGASAEGQISLLKEYRVIEEFVGAPIRATMDVTQIAKTPDGRPVFIDAFAAEADHVIVVNRIKAHTAFRGRYESGLMKMMVIGMGKQKGAETCHDRGFGFMAEDLAVFGNAILQNAPILMGVALIENAYDETCRIEALSAEEIPAEEPELLKYAVSRMGKILFPEIDVLVVDRIGKNISGDGMDPNVTGRFPTPYGSGWLKAQRTAVLDLTDETHGNCFGVGMADVTTQRLLDKSNLEVMYVNALTSTLLPATKIPMVARSQREAIGICIKTCNNIDRNAPRIVRIRDTLHLGEIMVSEALLEEAEQNDRIEILGKPEFMRFDETGDLF